MAATAQPLAAYARKHVLVTANKGGAGKTTTCIHIATAAARDGLRVIGIDLEPQHNFAKWGARRVQRGDGYPPVPVIAGDLDDYKTALTRAQDYDLVVIDTPPGIAPNMLAIQTLAREADYVLVPTGLGIFDIETVVPYAETLRQARGRKVDFVMNRIDSRVMGAELNETIAMLNRVGRCNATPIPTLIDIERYMKAGLSVVDLQTKRGAVNVMNLWSVVKDGVSLG